VMKTPVEGKNWRRGPADSDDDDDDDDDDSDDVEPTTIVRGDAF